MLEYLPSLLFAKDRKFALNVHNGVLKAVMYGTLGKGPSVLRSFGDGKISLRISVTFEGKLNEEEEEEEKTDIRDYSHVRSPFRLD